MEKYIEMITPYLLLVGLILLIIMIVRRIIVDMKVDKEVEEFFKNQNEAIKLQLATLEQEYAKAKVESSQKIKEFAEETTKKRPGRPKKEGTK